MDSAAGGEATASQSVIVGSGSTGGLPCGSSRLGEGLREYGTGGRCGGRRFLTFEGRAETMNRDECEELVKGPGQFEGEAVYVPFYWEVYLDGGADRDDGRVLGFDVTDDDKALFPELKRRRTVKLVQRDDGFVCEV